MGGVVALALHEEDDGDANSTTTSWHRQTVEGLLKYADLTKDDYINIKHLENVFEDEKEREDILEAYNDLGASPMDEVEEDQLCHDEILQHDTIVNKDRSKQENHEDPSAERFFADEMMIMKESQKSFSRVEEEDEDPNLEWCRTFWGDSVKSYWNEVIKNKNEEHYKSTPGEDKNNCHDKNVSHGDHDDPTTWCASSSSSQILRDSMTLPSRKNDLHREDGQCHEACGSVVDTEHHEKKRMMTVPRNCKSPKNMKFCIRCRHLAEQALKNGGVETSIRPNEVQLGRGEINDDDEEEQQYMMTSASSSCVCTGFCMACWLQYDHPSKSIEAVVCPWCKSVVRSWRFTSTPHQ